MAAPEPAKVEHPAAIPTMTVTVNNALPVRIVLSEDIPADAEEGAVLHFTALADFRVGDVVVIAKGAGISGVIADVGKKKFLGKGKTTFRLEKADSVDGQKLNVRAAATRRGDDPGTRPVDSGKGAKSKEFAATRGAEYLAYIDGDQTITIHK
jgi:hypothetical protein